MDWYRGTAKLLYLDSGFMWFQNYKHYYLMYTYLLYRFYSQCFWLQPLKHMPGVSICLGADVNQMVCYICLNVSQISAFILQVVKSGAWVQRHYKMLSSVREKDVLCESPKSSVEGERTKYRRIMDSSS